MNGFLLDTNIALIAAAEPERLSQEAKDALSAGPAFLSSISYWEVVVKSMKGTLNVGDSRRWWEESLEALALRPLNFLPSHIGAIIDLPSFHQDPFDRALIAQSLVEELVFVTMDRALKPYFSHADRILV